MGGALVALHDPHLFADEKWALLLGLEARLLLKFPDLQQVVPLSLWLAQVRHGGRDGQIAARIDRRNMFQPLDGDRA